MAQYSSPRVMGRLSMLSMMTLCVHRIWILWQVNFFIFLQQALEFRPIPSGMEVHLQTGPKSGHTDSEIHTGSTSDLAPQRYILVTSGGAHMKKSTWHQRA